MEKLAQALRWLADKASPAPVTIYPADSAIRYEGQRFRVVALRAEREVSRYDDNVADYYKKRMALDLANEAAQAIEWQIEGDENINKIKARLIIGIYEEIKI